MRVHERPGSAVEAPLPPLEDRLRHAGWLRAAVLGADDGIVSTAALVVGVAASHVSSSAVLISGIAGIVAGAASMGAGEYISVASQRDLERSLLRRLSERVDSYPEVALTELAISLQLRGVDPGLARRVAEQISVDDPVGAAARVRLGLNEMTLAQPVQAALASAAAFTAGGLIPLISMFFGNAGAIIPRVVCAALAALAISGALGAVAGGAPWRPASLRVVLGGGFAMALSALVGRLVGAAL